MTESGHPQQGDINNNKTKIVEEFKYEQGTEKKTGKRTKKS